MRNQQVARFRQVALARIERVEHDWNRLVQGGASGDLAPELRRELDALDGEAEVVGFEEVSLVCRKLESMICGAERHAHRVPQELDLMVMMAIRFVALFAGKQEGRDLAAIDLAGFIRHVDEVLGDLERTPVAEATAVAAPVPGGLSGGPVVDRLSPGSRSRLGRAAVLAFIESVRSTGAARDHLREVWCILADELSGLGAVALAPRVRQHAHETGEQARAAGRQVDIAVDLPDDLRVSPEVADALDAAFPRLLKSAVVHGIESPATRGARGKTSAGRVTVRCEEAAGEGAVLVVEDDGGGIDLAAVRRRAQEAGRVDPCVKPGRDELLELLFDGAGLGAVRSALVAVGGDVAIRTAAGQGTCVRLRAPRADATLAVHTFTACGGLDLALAVPASWTVAPIDGNPVAADPLAALVPDVASRAPTDGFALRLTRGRFDFCWRAVGPVRQATAERIGAPGDDQPAEVVRVGGREVLLLRPELS